MSETPVVIRETPVFDSRAFVLHWENEAYLRGKRPTPYLTDSEGQMIVAGFVIATFLCCLGAFFIFAESNWQPAMLISGVVLLLAGGVGMVGVFVYTNPARQKAILDGFLIAGEVLKSEKIRIEGGKGSRERIGVYYQFMTPEGRLIRSRAEASNDFQREKMAPAPGSPVYIWYDRQGNHTLL